MSRAGKVIFSVCLGDYDTIRPLVPSEGFRHVMFTDNPDMPCDGWEKIVVKPEQNIRKQSRHIKLLPHRYIDGDLFVYVDANYEIKADINPYVRMYFRGGLLLTRHPTRSCVYQEQKAVLDAKKCAQSVVNQQVLAYQLQGMPKNYGMFANNFFIRDRTADDFCELWFHEIDKHSYRDQISLPFLLWKHRYPAGVVEWRIKDAFLTMHPHNDGTCMAAPPKVWYFVPGAGNKQYGAALNAHCSLVPNDNDWILIRDNDTCFLNPYINRQIESIIARHGADYDLLSCYTNRLGLPWQMPYGMSDNPDILHHKRIADKHFDELYDEVEGTTKNVAGLFMLFPKKTWSKHPFCEGISEDGKFFDYRFADAVRQSGGKIGICKGIYLFHYYRMHQSDPKEHPHLN
jgi:hypothetical protein